jgi:hypothetical protein
MTPAPFTRERMCLKNVTSRTLTWYRHSFQVDRNPPLPSSPLFVRERRRWWRVQWKRVSLRCAGIANGTALDSGVAATPSEAKFSARVFPVLDTCQPCINPAQRAWFLLISPAPQRRAPTTHTEAGSRRDPAVDTALWLALGLFIMSYPMYIAGPPGHGGSCLHNG